jgi:hypothetical protein
MSLGSLARGMLLVWTIALLSGSTAGAEVAVSANDGKPKLTDGVVTVDPNRAPDNIVILDLKGPIPKVIATVANVPTSVVGPPTSVAITPDESLALVSASTKVDPNDPTKFVNDNALTVIDLKANPPPSSRSWKPARAPQVFPSTSRARWRWWRTAVTAPSPSSPSRGRR